MTIEVSRRQLMASMGGMVLASFALPPALRKALDDAPPSVLSSAKKVPPVSDIKHVVVLMQENRSFDHYFGAMPGVRGFARPGRFQAGLLPEGRLQPQGVPAAVPHRHHDDQRPADPVHQPQLGAAARQLGRRQDGRVRDRPHRGQRLGRAVHDGLLQAGRHPVPLGPGGRVHRLRRLPRVDARPDLAESAVPDDRPGRPGRRARRPGLRATSCRPRASPGRPTRRC